ncbi:granulins-like [Centruroides sculpturatus]|uniref:granulins-like n=1 Tax=Centruroides sculpturatus TaxID=218467 RepID=UPI000C6E34E4|nr:granulins-like [Centruroides sculpturatus]
MKNLLLLSFLIVSIFSVNRSEDDTNLICEDGTICVKNGTCCPGKDNSNMCCPVENAVCCTDGEHCCPANTRCDLRQMRCVGVLLHQVSDYSIFLKHTKPASKVNSICPDGKHYCQGSETCCVSSVGNKCCPYSFGSCCADGLHCCPANTICIDNKYCSPDRGKNISIMDTMSVSPQDVTCKDGHRCQDGDTCCQLPSGDWGCCPFENAVCCPDKIHCCPAKTTCDDYNAICISSDENYSCKQSFLNRPSFSFISFYIAKAMKNVLVLSFLILSTFYGDIECFENDANLICEDGTVCVKNGTCCPGKGNSSMCCPVENAVCCMDGEHCCPANTRCDLRQMRCVGVLLHQVSDYSIFLKHTKPASKVNSMCPDGKHYCQGSETCCVSSVGNKCCPYSFGSCCTDGLHCCPANTICIDNKICLPHRDKNISVMETMSASQQDVTCKDGGHCKDGDTCCQLPSGDWGCCPFENAVCCPDKIHCCPANTTCDMNTCTRKDDDSSYVNGFYNLAIADSNKVIEVNDSLFIRRKQYIGRVLPQQLVYIQERVEKSVSSFSELRGSKTTSMMNALWFLTLFAVTAICPDVNGEDIAPLQESNNLLQITKEASSVNNYCPDRIHMCQGSDPCCITPAGQYTCCPYPAGSCCTDGLHCCPYGLVCYRNNTCIKAKEGRVFTKLKTLRALKFEDVVCEDQTRCNDNATCCQLQSGQWGCCPLPNAVCCSDKVHCCPQDTICDVREGVCLTGAVKMPFL